MAHGAWHVQGLEVRFLEVRSVWCAACTHRDAVLDTDVLDGIIVAERSEQTHGGQVAHLSLSSLTVFQLATGFSAEQTHQLHKCL